MIKDKELIIPRLSELLINSVKKRTKGKVGIAFSGGVDSTLLAFICSKLNVEFKLYNVGYEGAEDLILRSEGFKKVAEKIKAIEVEFHYPTWAQLVQYMTELGYQARRYESSAIIVLFTR